MDDSLVYLVDSKAGYARRLFKKKRVNFELFFFLFI